ncbi:MAG: HNH endonuclease [Marivivens sp.]|nr:HNH endonuclease [Marivivens sp.]NBX10198.1 HNH endonuclease [Marivivens sp.]NDH03919.1 HNH endonuclease [Marivivens sp.]
MSRDYSKEYRDYHAKPEQKKNRASRNAARRSLMKSGRVRKGDGKDVDHKNGNPRDNARKNLSVMSRSANRSKK